MEIGGINQPTNQCPGFLRVPAPPTSPGFIRPDCTADDANREQQKANRDRAVTQAVELLGATEMN